MPWTYTYDVNTPVGTDDPKEGDDRIREVKAALQERLAKDHYFPKDGSEVSDTDAGEHKKVTLRVGDAPTHGADKVIIYAKNVNDIATPFYINEDGNEIQLTQPKIHVAVGTSNISTESSSFADMADMSITATFPAGKVLIEFNAPIVSVAQSYIIIDIGGVEKYQGGQYLSGTAVLRWVETLTAGEHTIKIRWRTLSETSVQSGTSFPRILTIMECR